MKLSNANPERKLHPFWFILFLIISMGTFLAQDVMAKCGGGGNRTYHFAGKVELNHNGTTMPLEGVQIRIVRKGSPVKWAQGPDVTTDSNGNFDVDCQFARDRNGAIARGKKIRFKLMARFRNDDFKVRKGGWFKNNWFTIAEVNGCRRTHKNRPWPIKDISACMDYQHTNIHKQFNSNNRPGKLAHIWWFTNELDNQLANQGVGLTDRPIYSRKLAITFPDRHIRKWYQDNFTNQQSLSWFMLNMHLEENAWDDRETIIHEYMHRWDVGHTKGSASLLCLFDKHHRAPNDTEAAAKCSGFMEGFAEAMAQELNQELFSGATPPSYTHWELRSNNAGNYNYGAENLDEAQRTDLGWYNFLTFLWKTNVWDGWGAADNSWCNPTHVSVFETLQALRDEHPRKAKWLVHGNSTFEWFTTILEDQISNFDSRDAKFYQLLGDPDLTAKEIRSEMCLVNPTPIMEYPVITIPDSL